MTAPYGHWPYDYGKAADMQAHVREEMMTKYEIKFKPSQDQMPRRAIAVFGATFGIIVILLRCWCRYGCRSESRQGSVLTQVATTTATPIGIISQQNGPAVNPVNPIQYATRIESPPPPGFVPNFESAPSNSAATHPDGSMPPSPGFTLNADENMSQEKGNMPPENGNMPSTAGPYHGTNLHNAPPPYSVVNNAYNAISNASH